MARPQDIKWKHEVEMEKEGGVINKSWKTRYIRIRPGFMCYYDKKEDLYPIGELILDEKTLVNVVKDAKSAESSLEITVGLSLTKQPKSAPKVCKNRCYHFSTENNEELDALNKAIVGCKIKSLCDMYTANQQ